MGESRVSPARIKELCNWSHALGRAEERFDMPRWIFAQAGEAVKVHVAGGLPLYQVAPLCPDMGGHKNRSWFAVYVHGQWRGVVFDHSTMSPVTAVPPWAIDRWATELDRMVPDVAETKEHAIAARDSDLLLEVYEASQECMDRVLSKSPRLMRAICAIHQRFNYGAD